MKWALIPILAVIGWRAIRWCAAGLRDRQATLSKGYRNGLRLMQAEGPPMPTGRRRPAASQQASAAGALSRPWSDNR